MYSATRELSYSLAINEALWQKMDADAGVILVGQGVKSPWYVGNTARGLLDRFGPERVIDTPVSENAVTGAAVGAAIVGMRPVVVHPRADFALYAFDPIINQAANWFYMSGGRTPVPVVFWLIVNRGGEQAAQHSQALHGMLAHVPGLKVVMPYTAADAKGLMVAAIEDNNPVVFIDDRRLYGETGPVPEALCRTPIGKGAVRREGSDITLVASSQAVRIALDAAEELAASGIAAEVVDLRTAKPLDVDLLASSVRKTHCAVIVDSGWLTGGLAAEVASVLQERTFTDLFAPVRRVALPDAPAPASLSLEEAYFLNSRRVIAATKACLGYRSLSQKSV